MTEKYDEIEIPSDINLNEVMERLLKVIREENPSFPVRWIIRGGTRYPRS